MCRNRVSASFGILLPAIFLIDSITFTHPLHAQAPAVGTEVSVKMIDAVDSGKDAPGKQYRAIAAKAAYASNGVSVEQGTAATVTLANGSGSGWTAQLVSVTVNDEPVAVTSGSASVTAGAQTAAGNAVSSINSALGGFGHNVHAPAAAVAIAAGQRVVLPTGTTLTFVISQPSASSQAVPIAPVASAAQPMVASSMPTPNPGSAPPVAAAGQHWWICRYVDPKDLNKPVLGKRIYFSVFPSMASPQDAGGNASAMAKHFITYVQQNQKVVTALTITPSGAYNGTAGGYCNRVSDDTAARTNSMNTIQKQWASSTPSVEAIPVNFADTPGEASIVTASSAPATATQQPTTASTGGSFIICATSGGPGMDTYLTGAFQTTRLRHMPSGGTLVDQAILDNFYAYLTQKGYKFKPGSNYGCAVKPTEAEAKADEQKRQSGCSNCGKIVETGWKE